MNYGCAPSISQQLHWLLFVSIVGSLAPYNARIPIRIKHQSGFTLIELSIVLVIIGLIIGGIMLGRELMEAAEIRSDIAQIEKLSTTINTFKEKYNCLPGDCANASMLLGGATQPEQVTNGNGDTLIRGFDSNSIDLNMNYRNAGPSSEWYNVFDHLAASRLINHTQYDETSTASNLAGIAYPKMKWQRGGTDPAGAPPTLDTSNGGIIVGYEVDGHYFRFGAGFASFWGISTMTFHRGYSPIVAREIDTKIDDGLPLSGRASVTTPDYIFRRRDTNPSGGPGRCVIYVHPIGDTNAYNTNSGYNYRICALRVRAPF